VGLARHMRAKPACSQTTWEENWLAVRDNRVVGPVCSRGHRGCRSQRLRLQLAAFEENCNGALHFIECASDVAGLKIDSTAAIDDDMCVQSELACIESCCIHASRLGSACASAAGERVLAIASFPCQLKTCSATKNQMKAVSARRRKSEPHWHLHARRVRYRDGQSRIPFRSL